MDELNFDEQAQSRFDALVDDGGDWSWAGLAAAFAARYGRADIEELVARLGRELENMQE